MAVCACWMAGTVSGRGAALLTLLSAGIGAYSLAFWMLRARGPTPEQHRAAAGFLRAHYQKGDAVFLLPPYATEARRFLGDLNTWSVQNPHYEDLGTIDRVWLYGLFGDGARVAEHFRQAGHRVLEPKSLEGGVRIFQVILQGAGQSVLWSAMSSLRSARVFHRHPDGREEVCRSWSERSHRGGRGGRWICPHDSAWFYVGPEWHRMGERPRRCLWAHPPAAGALVLSYQNVPTGGALQGRGGHTLNSSVRARAEVDLTVSIEGGEQTFHFDLTDTWRKFRVPVINSSSTATVSFAISSPNNGANHFCFEASIVRPRKRSPQ